MILSRFKGTLAALVAISVCLLLIAPTAMAGKGHGAYKLGGAWVAKVVEAPGQWTYVVAADPSSPEPGGVPEAFLTCRSHSGRPTAPEIGRAMAGGGWSGSGPGFRDPWGVGEGQLRPPITFQDRSASSFRRSPARISSASIGVVRSGSISRIRSAISSAGSGSRLPNRPI